jgi:hypothetical protein
MTVFLKSWISVGEETLDEPALSSSVFFNEKEGTVKLGFPSSAVEVSDYARGVKPTIERNVEKRIRFKTICHSRSGKLQEASRITVGYDVATQDAETTKAIAWVEMNVSAITTHPETLPVQIVNTITGDNQIIIKDGGKVEVSSNLTGKLVWVQLPCFVDKWVYVLPDDPRIDGFQFHAVTEDKVYITVPVKLIARLPTNDGIRWIEGTFEPAAIERKQL